MKTTPKKNGGFTLVELIVVIAILAILAAVAIPAYSGYIAKAEKAGDLQLLGAINSAFAAACVDNGFTQYDVQGAMIPVGENGTIGNGSITLSATPSAPKFISYVVKADGTSLATETLIAVNNSFALFFSGNETSAFKTYKNGLVWSPLEGGFVAMEDYEGEVTVSYKGNAFTVSAADIQKLTNSTYGEIGAEDLLGKVAFASGLCVTALGEDTSPLWSTVNTGDYKKNLAATLGFENARALNTYLDELEAATPGAKDKFLSNSLVLTAAQNSSTTVNESLLTNLASGSVSTKVDNVNDIAQTAAVYALYTAYAQDKGLETNGITGLTSLNAALGSEDFQKYAASDAAKADLDAYLTAMNVVNDATNGNTAGTKDVLVNGFSDAELNALLGSIMGN